MYKHNIGRPEQFTHTQTDPHIHTHTHTHTEIHTGSKRKESLALASGGRGRRSCQSPRLPLVAAPHPGRPLAVSARRAGRLVGVSPPHPLRLPVCACVIVCVCVCVQPAVWDERFVVSNCRPEDGPGLSLSLSLSLSVQC